MKNIILSLGIINLLFGFIILSFGNFYGVGFLMGGFIILEIMRGVKYFK